MLQFGLLSVFCKAIIWPIDYLVLAKGDKKQFFKQQLLGDIVQVSFVIFGYFFWGLLGVGAALTLQYVVSGGYLWWYVRKQYHFSLLPATRYLMGYCLLYCGGACFVFSSMHSDPIKNRVLSCIFLVSVAYCGYQLSVRISILDKIKRKVFRK